MRTVTAEAVEQQFRQFARLARGGERILVTEGGEPWVVLQPPPKATDPRPVSQWPDYPAHWAKHFPDGPTPGPTATELLAQEKEDRF